MTKRSTGTGSAGRGAPEPRGGPAPPAGGEPAQKVIGAFVRTLARVAAAPRPKPGRKEGSP